MVHRLSTYSGGLAACNLLLVTNQIYVGIEAGFIERDTGRQWAEETQELSRMIYGLMKPLREHNNPAR